MEEEPDEEPIQSAEESVSPNSISDVPTDVDTLGFEPYVAALCAFLTHDETKPPLTVSVEGEWGSGKSSFMKQLQKRLGEHARTVWFNAWRYEKQDELWAAFALEFIHELSKGRSLLERIRMELKLAFLRVDRERAKSFLLRSGGIAMVFGALAAFCYFFLLGGSVQRLTGAFQNLGDPAKLAASVGGAAGFLILALAGLRRFAKAVGSPLEIRIAEYLRDPKYETRTTFIQTFQADFKRLVQTYAGNQRVFVFIDDLDRCEVPKAAELMQALNLMISESLPVVYVLGLDREKIAAGLAAKYEKLLPYLYGEPAPANKTPTTAIEFGYNYLEKFIQIPFLLPQAVFSDLGRFLDALKPGASSNPGPPSPRSEVDAGLLITLSADSSNVRRVLEMVAPALDYNPRRLKQFTNLFRLRALLASQTGLFGLPSDAAKYDALTLEQLGKLVAIMLRWPLLLSDLERSPDLLADLAENLRQSPQRWVNLSPLLQFWLSKPLLRNLIAYGQGPVAPGNAYDLARVEIVRFLQVAPAIPGREIGAPREHPAADARPIYESNRSFQVNHALEYDPAKVAASAHLYKTEAPASPPPSHDEISAGGPENPEQASAKSA